MFLLPHFCVHIFPGIFIKNRQIVSCQGFKQDYKTVCFPEVKNVKHFRN